MNSVKVHLTKEQKDFIKSVGYRITAANGSTWSFFPYWLKETEGEEDELIYAGLLSTDIITMLDADIDAIFTANPVRMGKDLKSDGI